jgi:hypothetical protein
VEQVEQVESKSAVVEEPSTICSFRGRDRFLELGGGDEQRAKARAPVPFPRD